MLSFALSDVRFAYSAWTSTRLDAGILASGDTFGEEGCEFVGVEAIEEAFFVFATAVFGFFSPRFRAAISKSIWLSSSSSKNSTSSSPPAFGCPPPDFACCCDDCLANGTDCAILGTGLFWFAAVDGRSKAFISIQ